MPLIIDNDAELYAYPTIDDAHPADIKNQLTIGDLHANALKLIYFLVRQNVLSINDNDYMRLVSIYQNYDLTKNDLHEFNAILARIQVNPVGTVRLIGDEVADRGANDYFTLKIIQFLHKNKVPVEIILSNHGIDFIEAYETTD